MLLHCSAGWSASERLPRAQDGRTSAYAVWECTEWHLEQTKNSEPAHHRRTQSRRSAPQNTPVRAMTRPRTNIRRTLRSP